MSQLDVNFKPVKIAFLSLRGVKDDELNVVVLKDTGHAILMHDFVSAGIASTNLASFYVTRFWLQLAPFELINGFRLVLSTG